MDTLDTLNTHSFYLALIGRISILLLVFVLPIVIVWFRSRRKINETNKRAEIVMAVLEKNPDADVETLLKKVSPKKRLLKEKLLRKLLWACILTFFAVFAILWDLSLTVFGNGIEDLSRDMVYSLIVLIIGVALFINYFVGKRLLAKEIEAEQNDMINRN